jgi:hypothetical protein
MVMPLVAPADPPACAALVLDYRTWREHAGERWTFDGVAASGGALHVHGAEHLRDPAGPQFAAIAAAFAAARPTVAFFEGPDRGTAADAEGAITGGGESGYLRFLAARAGIPARSLEPSPRDLMAALAGRFDHDRVMVFFVLREAARLRDREAKAGAELNRAVAALLTRAAPVAAAAGLTIRVTDLAALDAAARRDWPGRDWRDFPADWFAPGEGPADARYLPAINTAVSDARNRHMVQLFAGAAAGGARVFAVVGRNHVPMIAPALRCALRR